jgi:hypothetical protein
MYVDIRRKVILAIQEHVSKDVVEGDEEHGFQTC